MTDGGALLFSPVSVGQRVVKNRIVSAAHNTNLDSRGVLTTAYADYIVRRAAGGPGLVMCFGAASVHAPCGSMQRRVSLWNPANEELLRKIADRVHGEDCLLMSQAAHIGRRGDSHQTGLPLQGPSDIPEPVHREIPHVLSRTEVAQVVDSFAAAAQRLERCGWDGIEISSYAGQLIEQFWSPKINVRHDEYGGDLSGRMRFSVEVVEAVRAAVSANFVLGFRMTGDPGAGAEELGLDASNMVEIARRLGDLNKIDLFHISGSSGATREAHAGIVPPDTYEPGCYMPLAHRMKETLSVPVIGTGRVLSVEHAEQALSDSDCDLVGMVRALIADPDLPKKAESGRYDDIRPCISIISGCSGRTGRGNTLGCSVNPAISYPEIERHPVAAVSRKVVVVGGGPAGLEAARVAALRGHNVLLIEREGAIGGQMLLAAAAPRRGRLLTYIQWLEREIMRLNVDLQLSTQYVVEDLPNFKADVLVDATGASSVIPPLADRSGVAATTDVDILAGRETIQRGSSVLIYDVEGGYRGGSVANLVAEAGARRVELATPLGMVCQELDKIQQPSMYRQLALNNVAWLPNLDLCGEGTSVGLRNLWSDAEYSLGNYDLIVFVGYRKANSAIYHSLELAGSEVEFYQIGDCLAPRRLLDATADGVRVGNTI